MDYQEFLTGIAARGGLETRDRAAVVARATLQTLAERLDDAAAGGLAAELPPELARYVTRLADQRAESFDVTEFVGRVAERADLAPAAALRLARLVVSELAGATSAARLAGICGRLPGEWHTLLDASEPGGWSVPPHPLPS